MAKPNAEYGPLDYPDDPEDVALVRHRAGTSVPAEHAYSEAERDRRELTERYARQAETRARAIDEVADQL